MRANGILLPISSLPSPYGIGCFSREAYAFIDQLEKAGQKYWQILPLGPTGYGDSPYQSFSTFAGNPYYIDLDRLVAKGWLLEEEVKELADNGPIRDTDYGKLFKTRYVLLKKAFLRSGIEKTEAFKRYCIQERYWLEDYALYMALKEEHHYRSWENWEESIRFRNPEALEIKKKQWKEEIFFHQFLQFLFQKQWKELRNYARAKGIKIIGDLPIYVSFDSADVWAGQQLFQMDDKGRPEAVAGVPPDGFSADGQVWGNPLYAWEYHEKTGYAWWMQRLASCFSLYDVVRIDHFRGFDEYYCVPYGDRTARRGTWKKGPGLSFFRKVKEKFPGRALIAEDLGYMTDSVRQLLNDTGYPGMKILEFAFDSRDSGNAREYLPHNYEKNTVVYTGTHDNETLTGWFTEGIREEERQMVRRYFHDEHTADEKMYKTMICGAMRSVADLCIIPMQDILGLDNRARMNRPSTTGINWKWRLKEDEFGEDEIRWLAEQTACYGR